MPVCRAGKLPHVRTADPSEPGSGLLERDPELDHARRTVTRAVAGDGALLVLEGPPGIGKTRLLEATRRLGEQEGMRVLAARGGRLERDFAYGVVRQLMERAVADATPAERDALLAGPAVHAGRAFELVPAPTSRTADDQAFAVRHGLYWMLSNLAMHEPVLVVVDDVQWADAPSLRFLAYLARRLEGVPVLVAVTARTGEPAADIALLAELIDAPDVERLEPAPLSVAAVATLLGDGAPVDEAFAVTCHTATGGNPFLVNELRAALRADGVAPVAANAHRVEGLGPSTIARSLILRVGAVSPAAVALARAVAVLGSSAELTDAATLADLEVEPAGAAGDGLAHAGVLAPGRPLRFAHPILRDAVYRDLATTEREALHRRAAARLTAVGAPSSAVAAHLLAIPAAGEQTTVRALRAAARSALDQGAADLAERYLRRALREPPPAAERAAVLAELGRATWLAGDDPLAAIEHLRGALATTADEAERPALSIALARAVFSTGDIVGAATVLEEELSRPVSRARDVRLTLEAELGSLYLLHQATPEHGRRILSFADLPGATVAELLVLTNVASWEWLAGSAADVRALVRRALAEGRAVAAAGSDSIAILQAAWTAAYADDHELAQQTIDATLADARRTGSVFGLTCSHAMAALIAYRAGDMVHAEAAARDGIAIPGLSPFAHPTLHWTLALALVERDELDEAEAVMERSWVGPHLPLLVQMTPGFWALGRLRMAQGRPADARDALLEGLARDTRTYTHNPGVPWRTDAALAHLALGERADAERLIAEHEPHARRWGTDSAVGVWLHAAAMIEPDDTAAIAGLERALETLARSPARLEHARAQVDLGARLRRAGLRDRARVELQAGLERARDCGATALVRRAHDELRVAGARPRRLQFSGVESLTASERRVCELAAAGRSNRDIAQDLFVTPKTVENHLGRAYGKLGISSRAQLPAALELLAG
jgi:DNA-binding CsgD family transcriptional regulator